MLVVAHGNSLRALRKHLEGISDDDIVDVEIPTGIPFCYELADDLAARAQALSRRPRGGRGRRRGGAPTGGLSPSARLTRLGFPAGTCERPAPKGRPFCPAGAARRRCGASRQPGEVLADVKSHCGYGEVRGRPSPAPRSGP